MQWTIETQPGKKKIRGSTLYSLELHEVTKEEGKSCTMSFIPINQCLLLVSKERQGKLRAEFSVLPSLIVSL